MKRLMKYMAVLPVIGAVAAFSGCSTAESPEYQGRSRSAPVIDDYYPSKTNQAAAKSPSDPHHVAVEDHAAIKIPNKAPEIFAETEKHLQALAAAVKSKDARAAVHEHDAAVRQLIGRIPQRATTDIKVHVEDHVREISDAAKSAHAAAHDEDWGKADADVKRAQESLKHLQARFKEIPQ